MQVLIDVTSARIGFRIWALCQNCGSIFGLGEVMFYEIRGPRFMTRSAVSDHIPTQRTIPLCVHIYIYIYIHRHRHINVYS